MLDGWVLGWVGVRVRVCLCVHVLYRVCKNVCCQRHSTRDSTLNLWLTLLHLK